MLRSKTIVPGDRPLIAIGYKYNTRKVLSFIVTDNVGATKTGIYYLYKCWGASLWYPGDRPLIDIGYKYNTRKAGKLPFYRRVTVVPNQIVLVCCGSQPH